MTLGYGEGKFGLQADQAASILKGTVTPARNVLSFFLYS